MKKDQHLKKIYLGIAVALLLMLFYQGYLLVRQYQLLQAKMYEVVLNSYNELNDRYTNATVTIKPFVAYNKVDNILKDSSIGMRTIIRKNGPITSSSMGSIDSIRVFKQRDSVIELTVKDFNYSIQDLNINPNSIKSIEVRNNGVRICDTCKDDHVKAVLIKVTIDAEKYTDKIERSYNSIDTILSNLYAPYKDIFSYEFALGDISGDSTIYYQGSFTHDTPEPFFKKSVGTREPLMFYLFAKMNLWYWVKHILFGIIISLILCSAIYYLFTQLKHIIDSQKKLDMMKTDFINNMTHEFKTPIATVSLALESIQNFGVRNQPEKMDEYLNIAQGELRKVNSMIEQVLNISKDSEFKLQLSEVDLQELVEESILQMRTIGDKHNASILMKVENEIPIMLLDKFHLNNVFVNLIDNSFKYKRVDPIIHITLKREEDYVKIYFRDNGKGIPQQYISHIFDNFFRVPSGNIHNVKGFGVGLSYVSKIIHEHKGSITVSSEENQFTEFIISLPIQQS